MRARCRARRSSRTSSIGLLVAALLAAACTGLVPTGADGTSGAGPRAPADGVDARGPATEVPRATDGQALVGAHLDWETDTAEAYAERLGAVPAVMGFFVRAPWDDTDRANLEVVAEQILEHDATMLLTLEVEGFDDVTEPVLSELGEWLERWNEVGLPVVVRFAHEMNGPWYPWGQQPERYVEAFRRVAAVVQGTPASEMLWAPNEAVGYPFEGQEHSPDPGSAEFEALDTDGDGQLTADDDPYAPYYPGDEHVDRVGLTLYHFGETYPWGDNVLPAPGKFTARIDGTYAGPEAEGSHLPDFYDEYARARDLPFDVVETAALTTRGDDGEDPLAVKQAWMEQVFDPELVERYPQLGMVLWFEFDKPEQVVGDEVVSWSVTRDPATRDAFVEALPSWASFAGP